MLTFRPLGPETFDDFARMHEKSECQGCFCMYWHFAGDNRAWQLAQPDENREAKRALVTERKTHGLLAYDGELVVATVQFEPRDTLVKLTARMPYRGLAPNATTWSITCFRVLEAHRKRGVATALLAATIDRLRALGATRIEAYPRRGEDLRDEEVWTGPESLFVRAGFHVTREHEQYPVLQLDVACD
jgi:GNAT superfamily N-acetyltransferase